MLGDALPEPVDLESLMLCYTKLWIELLDRSKINMTSLTLELENHFTIDA